MVLLALSAMASTSKLLSPQLNYAADGNTAERYKAIADNLLLNTGTPTNWGKGIHTNPESFGLARTGTDSLYDLDVDKITRLNSSNLYAIGYPQIFSSINIPDVSLRIEMKPVFDVNIDLVATFSKADQTIYNFRILTNKHGTAVTSNLKTYVIGQNLTASDNISALNGETYFNATLPNTLSGSALLVVLAESAYDNKFTSFGCYPFIHNSTPPESDDSFLRLIPLNDTLVAAFTHAPVPLSSAYALTFDGDLTLTQIGSNNESATYAIPCLLGSNLILVVTGVDSSRFFAEYISYPQIPLMFGANFDNSNTLSSVFTHTYLVTIESAIYECTIWIGGPKE
jgi:hypothetical protein